MPGKKTNRVFLKETVVSMYT
ncbi:MAG: hypothetical protein JST96_08905 [Bacteroidetes bacterium]|nr:hypothetical protein [Bacteroidota bacterium]